MGFKCKTGDEIATVRTTTVLKAYPDLKLNCDEKDFDEQGFLTRVRSNNPPDLAYLSRQTMGTFMANGAITPLTDCISKAGLDMTQFRDAAVKAVTWNGEVYGVPEFFNTRNILIDNKLATAAGVTPDQIDTSNWDNLKAANDKLFKKDGSKLSQLGFDPKLPEFLPLWAKINGVDILSADGKTSNLDDPKVAEALTFAASLITAQAKGPEFFAARDAVSADFFGKDNPVAKDKIAAFPMEQWYLNVLADTSPNVDITYKAPKTKDGQDITFSDGQAWGIPKGAKNPDAACAFATKMVATDTWAAAAQARADKRKADNKPCGGTYTANKAADDMIFNQICAAVPSPNKEFDDAIKATLANQDNAFEMPASPAAAAFQKIWMQAAQDVVNKGTDATQALQQADQDAQNELDSAGG